MNTPKTLLEKIWARHVVASETDCPDVMYIDLHLIHEVTSPQAFAEIASRGLTVRRPDKILATMDHSTPTKGASLADISPARRLQLETLEENCRKYGIELHAFGSEGNGIVHVIGPEQRRIRPGMTIVCGDSHTSTHGAFGALAFGIGTSQVGHVLATQCLLQSKPKSMAINYVGALPDGVSAKDLALTTVGRLGAGGGSGFVLEYRGECISELGMEGRMTLCNMSIEGGARAGLIAADATTSAYFGDAADDYSEWCSDNGAIFDKQIEVDVSKLEPQVTWGTHPCMTVGVNESIPKPSTQAEYKALAYMGVSGGTTIRDIPLHVVFIGSCTNGRLEDIQAAAEILVGNRVAEGIRMIVVPGSQRVKRKAEEQGYARVIKAAGAEWREPGCSMCLAMNGDTVDAGEYCLSTSNRNFEGRQGTGARTLLASPATAAASAIAGYITDPRKLQGVSHEV
ncbi:3-isopropylmalate dehydratase large subunit [Planctomycetota bacterium]|nr:3-isopropylmalate dehydratase large subunit [Planctomycetota bacterium]